MGAAPGGLSSETRAIPASESMRCTTATSCPSWLRYPPSPISLIEIAEGSKDKIRSAAYTAPFATIFTVLVLWVPNTTGVGENVTVVLVGNGFTIGPVGGAAGAAAVAARAAALTGVAVVEGAGGKPVAPVSIGAATDVRNRGKFTEPTFSPR